MCDLRVSFRAPAPDILLVLVSAEPCAFAVSDQVRSVSRVEVRGWSVGRVEANSESMVEVRYSERRGGFNKHTSKPRVKCNAAAG